jgi:SAM-dependent methyltransferase
MSSEPSNIYEASETNLKEENERLGSFDLPNKVSQDVIGKLEHGATLLDVGAGPNVSLFSYVRSQGGVYTALDKNNEFLKRQKKAGANTVNADVRNLPFENESFDVTHTRFVISHLGSDKQKAIAEILRVTKSTGRAIFMDYDWTSARGSKVFEKVKHFMVNGGFLFDADFGSELEAEIRKSNVSGGYKTLIHPPTLMTDYSQILKLREAGTTDLRLQYKDEALRKWNNVLDEFQKEASSDHPQGYYFPGVTVVTLAKGTSGAK